MDSLPSPPPALSGPLMLADWRRRVAALYAEVRGAEQPEQAWRAGRAGRDRLFREHPSSPLPEAARRTFEGLAFHDYDVALRYRVALEDLEGEEEQSWDIGADGLLRLRPVARTRGLEQSLGGELTLYWLLGYGGGLFLPFRDATSGRTTFGGGRYLIDAIKGADLGMVEGRVILDFNFAYNPSCAYSPAWTCPLAPPENRLPAAVRAGEKTPRS